MLLSKYENVIPMENWNEKLSFFEHYIKYNTFRLHKKDVLLFCISNALIEKDGETYDRQTQLLERELKIPYGKIIECGIPGYSERLKWIRNTDFVTKSFIDKIIIDETSCIRNDLKEEKRIRDFILFFTKNFSYSIEAGQQNNILNKLRFLYKSFPLYYKYYGELVYKTKCKLSISICGSYGLPYIRVLNEYGVVTSELQHASTYNCYPYRYSRVSKHLSEIKKCYPRFFLSWGDFWGGCDGPMDNILIGNPEIEESFKRLCDEDCSLPHSFLFVINNSHDDYIRYINCVLEWFKDSTVLVKIHPSARDTVKFYDCYACNNRVNIDIDNGFIYCLKNNRFVVGDASTALFEAHALGRIVFVINNSDARLYTSKRIGRWVTSTEELIQIVDSTDASKDIEKYEHVDWKCAFNRFVSMACNNAE